MVVHSLVITNGSGQILLTKYFISEENTEEFERRLLRNTTSYGMLDIRQAVSFSNKYVAFERFGDLNVYLTGIDDVEEESLSELLVFLRKLFKDVLEDRLSSISLLDPECCGKLDVALDEAFPEGICECLDAESVLKLAKMKNF